MDEDEEKELGFSPCGVGLLFWGLLDWTCSFLFRTAERETEPKRKAAGLIPEAKNRIIFPKTSKRHPLRSGWTVLVSLRKNNPIFFTPLERGRNFITGSMTESLYPRLDHFI
jgi:hypothetical protein